MSEPSVDEYASSPRSLLDEHGNELLNEWQESTSSTPPKANMKTPFSPFDFPPGNGTLSYRHMRLRATIGLCILSIATGLILITAANLKAVVAEADTPPSTDETGPGATDAPLVLKTPRTPPPQLRLPEGVEAVIKLAESGVEDSVLLAYIANSPSSFDLNADDILYLNDVGLSSTVVSAMINHSSQAQPSAPIARQPIPPSVPEISYPQVAATPPPMAVEAPLAPPVQDTYNYFYNSLQPYGDWVDVPDYGLCWQPTVAIVQPDWRPYCDRGHWLYSDYGWYWHSDYSWGWAPFHYGRWHHAPRHGWVWIPDTTWGASWVCWRQNEGFCGWAPLPPSAVFRPGIGFTFHDSHVGIGFGFGLGYDRFTFVPTRHFYDRNPRVFATSRSQTVNIYKNTTVVNNYIQGNNHTVINEGVGRDHIAAATHQEIRKVTVRDVPSSTAVNVRPERLERSGAAPVIYRPTPPPVKTQAAEIVRVQQQQPHIISGITPARPEPVNRLEARSTTSPLVNPEPPVRRNEITRTAPSPLNRNQEPIRQSIPETRPAPKPSTAPVYRNQEPIREPIPEVRPNVPENPRQEIRRPEYQTPPNSAPAPSPSYNSRPFLSPGPSMAPSTIPRQTWSPPVSVSPSVPNVPQHSSPAPAPPPVQHSQPQPQPAPRSNTREEQRR